VPEQVPDDRPDPSAERAHLLAGVAVWSMDLRTGRLRTNAATRALLGWSDARDTSSHDELMQAVHPEDRPAALACLQALLETGTEFDVEHRVVRADGSSGHVRAVGCAEQDEDGRVVAVHGVSTDITELRSAARALELEQERSRGVLGSMTEGYLLMRDSVIVEANSAVCEMTGFSEAELVGSGPPYPYWPAEDAARLGAARDAMVRSGKGVGEFTAVRKDGARRRLAVTARVLATPTGPTLWLVLLRDVTAERERERSLTEQAAADPLTGVHNSRTFRQDLHDAVLVCAGAPLSLALIDVDHFKAVNDRFGHPAGDEVLITVVTRLVAATSGAGTLARVGGEEFALLMPGLTAEQGHRVVQRALVALSATPIGRVGTVTASAGVAELLDGMTDDALYRLADALMYEAKHRGRNQVR
jgi:diguanylate cyclase (GGDEF)-like protein/PAS domain S-box-containing protein